MHVSNRKKVQKKETPCHTIEFLLLSLNEKVLSAVSIVPSVPIDTSDNSMMTTIYGYLPSVSSNLNAI